VPQNDKPVVVGARPNILRLLRVGATRLTRWFVLDAAHLLIPSASANLYIRSERMSNRGTTLRPEADQPAHFAEPAQDFTSLEIAASSFLPRCASKIGQ